jgi:hypothetical protein
LQQLGVLTQMLADQPQQVVHGPLFTTGCAVAVVQEEDHYRTYTGNGRLSRAGWVD